MMLEMLDIAQAVVRVASGDDEGNGKLALLALLLAGPGYYGWIYARYRNVGRRHHHETDTKAETANVRTRDEFAGRLTKLKNSKMVGANEHAVQGALNAGAGAMSQLLGGVIRRNG